MFLLFLLWFKTTQNLSVIMWIIFVVLAKASRYFFYNCHCTLSDYKSHGQVEFFWSIYFIYYYLLLSLCLLFISPIPSVNGVWYGVWMVYECYLFILFACLSCSSIYSCSNICYSFLLKFVHILFVIPKTWFQHYSFDFDATIFVACSMCMITHFNPIFCSDFGWLISRVFNQLYYFFTLCLYFTMYS